MKRFILLCIALWVLVFAAPFFSVSFFGESEDIPYLPLPEQSSDEKNVDSGVKVTLNHEGNITEIALDEYLLGVVSAEMPALFPEEALKAQAVAARTYTLKKLSSSPATEHNGAALCSSPAHCKAYRPISETAASWGESSGEYTEKIRNAVTSTDGEIILYDNEPISAVFHSTSSGKTENAKDVWGSEVAYLKSVKSPGEEASPRFEEIKSVSPDEFKEKFLSKYPETSFGDNPENWFSEISRSEAGGITAISVCGTKTSGSVIRSLLGLNSTNFTVTYRDGLFHFSTRGYGHGVGMSQYGAKAMAESGKTYTEILESYYTGVTFGKIS